MQFELLYILCIVMLFLMIIVAVVGVFFYVRHNNKLMKETLKKQNHEEFLTFRKDIENMNKELVANVTNSIKEDTSNTVPVLQQQQPQEDLLTTFSKIRSIIKDDLYITMNKTQACRTALYLFHNGTKSTKGLSFLKVSCIGERTLIGSGVKEQILNHNNMPVNIFDNMINKLIENGRYVIMNDEQTMQTARAQFISASKIRYSQAISIFDTNNNILGFILAEFDHTYTKQLSDEEYSKIKELCIKIAPILSFSNYADLTLNNKITDMVQGD